jgi:hypothetical protein
VDALEQTPILDASFACRYEAVARGRLPTPDDLLYFPSRPTLLVEVTPGRGAPWTGAFGEEWASPAYATGLYTTPERDTICVVASGAGYFVNTTEPESAWIPVACTPIRLVLPFRKLGLLVFGNFTDFTAYRFDPEQATIMKVAWRSARLGWDDLAVTRTTDDRIEGHAWHTPRPHGRLQPRCCDGRPRRRRLPARELNLRGHSGTLAQWSGPTPEDRPDSGRKSSIPDHDDCDGDRH